ncbi:hypothetical protein [Psychromonas aquimarina]|uniref:hypothetical protein n=1 Tax=Psychromonas aquimarina TaxID=444919 RepID=UPI000401F9A7|nr:hypothetical protein [Psychromonas aquimarina]
MSGLEKLITNQTLISSELQRIEDEKKAYTSSLRKKCEELNIRYYSSESDEQLLAKIKRGKRKVKTPEDECYVVFSIVPKSEVYPTSIKVGITQYLSSYYKSIKEAENGFVIHHYRFENKQAALEMQSGVFNSMERKRLGQYASSRHRITLTALTDGTLDPIIEDSEYSLEEIESKVQGLAGLSKYS